MASEDEVVVVGNGVSAYACASNLAAAGRRVRMIGPGPPHDRPPLSKRALTTGRLPVFADPAGVGEHGIDHVDGLVRNIDLDRRRLEVLTEEGAQTLGVDAAGPLVWATGLDYASPPVPGLEEAPVNATGPGFTAVTEALAESGAEVVIVGAGLIGVETAATLAGRHRTTLIDLADRPLPRLHDPVPGLAEAALRELDVRFLGGCRLQEVVPEPGDGSRRYRLHTSTHGDLNADLIVAATGASGLAEPRLGSAGSAPLETDGALRVLGLEQVWACGDCAAVPHPVHGVLSFAHWDWARRTGIHAAESIRGIAGPFEADPFWFSTIGPLHLHEVGLADAAVEWAHVDGMHVGRDAGGAAVAILLVNAPARLGEAHRLLDRTAS